MFVSRLKVQTMKLWLALYLMNSMMLMPSLKPVDLGPFINLFLNPIHSFTWTAYLDVSLSFLIIFVT